MSKADLHFQKPKELGIQCNNIQAYSFIHSLSCVLFAKIWSFGLSYVQYKTFFLFVNQRRLTSRPYSKTQVDCHRKKMRDSGIRCVSQSLCLSQCTLHPNIREFLSSFGLIRIYSGINSPPKSGTRQIAIVSALPRINPLRPAKSSLLLLFLTNTGAGRCVDCQLPNSR